VPPRDFDLDLQAIRRRLESEGWTMRTAKGDHDVYKHTRRRGRIPVPRGRGDLPLGTARNIANAAGWVQKDRER